MDKTKVMRYPEISKNGERRQDSWILGPGIVLSGHTLMCSQLQKQVYLMFRVYHIDAFFCVCVQDLPQKFDDYLGNII
jgi:hypothetical protein